MNIVAFIIIRLYDDDDEIMIFLSALHLCPDDVVVLPHNCCLTHKIYRIKTCLDPSVACRAI